MDPTLRRVLLAMWIVVRVVAVFTAVAVVTVFGFCLAMMSPSSSRRR